MLFINGGWWVDMDIICLKQFDFKDEYCFSSEYNQQNVFPNIGCIKCPKESEFMLDLLSILEEYLATGDEVRWGTFGPQFFKKMLKNYESEQYVYSPETFIMPSIICSEQKELDFYNLFTKNSTKAITNGLNGYSIHLYNELWRLKGINKLDPFPDKSVLKYLSNKYL